MRIQFAPGSLPSNGLDTKKAKKSCCNNSPSQNNHLNLTSPKKIVAVGRWDASNRQLKFVI